MEIPKFSPNLVSAIVLLWKEELIGKLGKLDLQTGFVKLYRLEFSSRNVIIGKTEETNIDAGDAYVV